MPHPASPRVADRLVPFGTSVFAEMTALATQHQAVNLAQGFPDFDGPEPVKEAAIDAIRAGHSQYARLIGAPPLNQAIAQQCQRRGFGAVDPDAEVTVTTGCTQAIPSAMLGLLNPGDEVVLFEPFYDSYRACVALAGATPRFVRLRPPSAPSAAHAPFTFDQRELRSAFRARTRAILVNTPHNPTGKVFTREELELIARLCVEHDVLAITDEVYEHLTYEPSLPHVSLATLPGMRERTVTLSSLGKTFSLTGWKVGWIVAPPHLSAGARAAHQFLTFGCAAPLQHAAAFALTHAMDYPPRLCAQFREHRDFLAGVLRELGFGVHLPAASYFILADHSRFGFPDDRSFCRHLTASVGVAAIPPSAFYSEPAPARTLARFAFCKRRETLELAAQRLRSLRPA